MARDVLEALAEKSRETVALHVPAGTQRVCVAQVPSPQPVRYTSSVGAARLFIPGSMLARCFWHSPTRGPARDLGSADADPSHAAANGH